MDVNKHMKFAITYLLLMITISAYTMEFHVSPSGNDNNSGTLEAPWASVQFAMEEATVGSTVYIHAGVYNESLYMSVNGTVANPIKFVNFEDDEVILDGSGLESGAILEIFDNNFVTVEGLIFQNLVKNDAIGILIEGKCSGITIMNCKISNISFSGDPNASINENTNSQPLIVYGTEEVTALKIIGNEIFDCRTGYSEALALNGNVAGFQVIGNIIHDISNIGIDIIGHEETASDPLLDQARNGKIAENEVYNCISPYATAAGIYVDGGANLIIERNLVYSNQWGIEIGCENVGKVSHSIVVRNNFIFENESSGIQIGGYDYPNGSGKVNDAIIINNSLFSNDLENSGSGELYISYNENLEIFNNVFYATNSSNMLIATEDLSVFSIGMQIHNNLFYTSSGSGNEEFYFESKDYESLFALEQDAVSVSGNFSFDPIFTSLSGNTDLHLAENSPAINKGILNDQALYGEEDIDGEIRISNGVIDLGADEANAPVSGISTENIDSLTIYPNPVLRNLNFSKFTYQSAKVFDSLGRIVLQGNSVDSGLLDVSQLTCGTYTAVLRTSDCSHVARFIKI